MPADRPKTRRHAPDSAPPAPAAAAAPFSERRDNAGGYRITRPTPRVGLLIVAAIVVGFLLYLGREALSPFVVGLILVYLLHPPVERLARLGLARWLSILVVYVVAAVAVAQALGFMLRPLAEQIRAFVGDLPGFLAQAQTVYRSLDLPPQLREGIDHWLAQAGTGQGINPSVLLPVVNLTAGFVSAIFGYIIIPVWAFYLLKDRPALTVAFDRSVPAAWRSDVWEVIHIVERVFGQWIRGQLFLCLVVGVATFIGLIVLGATIHPVFGRFALLLAVIAGVLELLPIIGPIIAAIPALLLAATAGVQPVIAALVLYTLVQQVENNVLVPKIQGDAVEMHPSAVMFALVVGGAIAGLLGAILALPITAAGRDVFRYLFTRASGGPVEQGATAGA